MLSDNCRLGPGHIHTQHANIHLHDLGLIDRDVRARARTVCRPCKEGEQGEIKKYLNGSGPYLH